MSTRQAGEEDSLIESQTLNQVINEEKIMVKEEEIKVEESSSSLLGAVFNLVNATIGAGMIQNKFKILKFKKQRNPWCTFCFQTNRFDFWFNFSLYWCCSRYSFFVISQSR